MDIKVEVGNIVEVDADTIIVNLFEGVSYPGGATGAVDLALGGAIQDLIAGGDFRGKQEDVAVIYPRGSIRPRRVLVVGLGKVENFNLEVVRRASAAAIKRARDLNAKKVATIIHGGGIGGLDLQEAAQATVEGSLLALYRYQAPRKSPDEPKEIFSLQIVEIDPSKIRALEAAARRAQMIVESVYLARDLVNLPPNVATPTKLAEVAVDIANAHGMRLTIGDREWAAEQGMGAFLAVAKGAGEPPKFIVMEHNADKEHLDTLVLVGKGITFDTGGISIKPSEKMDEMKSDMGGAAAVICTMDVVGKLNLPLRVIGIAPCTENMPDGLAFRPADVVTASNGKTVEIISTDAEGRLILADALVYAGRFNPIAVIDLATFNRSLCNCTR